MALVEDNAVLASRQFDMGNSGQKVMAQRPFLLLGLALVALVMACTGTKTTGTPTPTPTPTITPTATPMPTATPTPTLTATVAPITGPAINAERARETLLELGVDPEGIQRTLEDLAQLARSRSWNSSMSNTKGCGIRMGLSDDEITRVLEELQQPLSRTTDDGSWKPNFATILQGYGIDEAKVQKMLVEAEAWVTKVQIRNRWMANIAAELATYGIGEEGVIRVVLASGYEEGLVEDRPRQTLREFGLSEVGAQRVIMAMDEQAARAVDYNSSRSNTQTRIKQIGVDDEVAEGILAGLDELVARADFDYGSWKSNTAITLQRFVDKEGLNSLFTAMDEQAARAADYNSSRSNTQTRIKQIGVDDEVAGGILAELDALVARVAFDYGSWRKKTLTDIQQIGIGEEGVNSIFTAMDEQAARAVDYNSSRSNTQTRIKQIGVDDEVAGGILAELDELVARVAFDYGSWRKKTIADIQQIGIGEEGVNSIGAALDDLFEAAKNWRATIRSTADMMIEYGIDQEGRQGILLEAGIDITAALTPITTPTPSPAPTATPTPTPTRDNPDLEIVKFLNSEFHYGQSGSYTFQIGNVGTGTARSPISVVDVLLDGFTFDSFSDPFTTDWACTASGQQVTCVYTGPEISPGGFLPALIITVTIAPIEQFPGDSDAVDNCAQVLHPDDLNPVNDRSCVSTIITPSGAAG